MTHKWFHNMNISTFSCFCVLCCLLGIAVQMESKLAVVVILGLLYIRGIVHLVAYVLITLLIRLL